MCTALRLVVGAALVAGLLGGLTWLAVLGLDFADLPALLGKLAEESAKEEELQRRLDVLVPSVVAKDQPVDDLLAGRLSLLQAAARFRDSLRQAADTLAGRRLAAPGPEQGERLCREVMAWVDVRLRDRAPQQAAAVALRLEAELQQHRAPDGTVRLPD
jgi:hypothetical protein